LQDQCGLNAVTALSMERNMLDNKFIDDDVAEGVDGASSSS
jgi:hypothetical protein